MRRSIKISTGALAFFCLLFYVNPNGIFLPFLLAAAAHEMGHMAACRLSGGEIHAVYISVAGAEMVAAFSSFAGEVFSVLAGPLVNLLLAAMFLQTKFQFALVNLFLAAYNLLPVLPLDGGRLAHLLLSRRWPSAADRIMRILTIALTVGVIGWGVMATCAWHYGLWPCLFAAALLLKTGAAIASEKSLAK